MQQKAPEQVYRGSRSSIEQALNSARRIHQATSSLDMDDASELIQPVASVSMMQRPLVAGRYYYCMLVITLICITRTELNTSACSAQCILQTELYHLLVLEFSTLSGRDSRTRFTSICHYEMIR